MLARPRLTIASNTFAVIPPDLLLELGDFHPGLTLFLEAHDSLAKRKSLVV